MLRLRDSHRAHWRPVFGGVLVSTVVCGAGFFGTSASADLGDEKATIDKKIASLEDDLDGTSVKLNAAYGALTTTRAQLPAAEQALADAQAASAAADQRNAAAVAALAVARADEAEALADFEATEDALTQVRDRVAGFAAQMYQEQGLGSLEAVLGGGDPSQIADRMAMADVVVDVQNGQLSSLATAAADLTAQQDRLSALRAKVADAVTLTEQALAAANAAQSTAAQAKAALLDLESEQADAAASLETQRVNEEVRLKGLQADSDAVAKKLRAIARAEAAAKKKADAEAKAAEEAKNTPSSPATTGNTPSPVAPTPPPTTTPPPSSGGFLSAPTSAGVSSEFGWRFHPILHYYRLHSGRDYGAACGTPVYAAADGSVVSAGWAGGYGNQMVLSHGIQRGVSLGTTYNHLSQFAVTGGSVARGQVIGYVGTTGMSTGCHLHFETRENGTPVDPRNWL